MHIITLAHETDFDGWRRATRALVLDDVSPSEVVWQMHDAREPKRKLDEDLFFDRRSPKHGGQISARLARQRAFGVHPAQRRELGGVLDPDEQLPRADGGGAWRDGSDL